MWWMKVHLMIVWTLYHPKGGNKTIHLQTWYESVETIVGILVSPAAALSWLTRSWISLYISINTICIYCWFWIIFLIGGTSFWIRDKPALGNSLLSLLQSHWRNTMTDLDFATSWALKGDLFDYNHWQKSWFIIIMIKLIHPKQYYC